jgi:pyridoxamine 5'-phosphate oxidase
MVICEIGLAGFDIAAAQLVLVGKADGVDDEIEAAPFRLERGEQRVETFGIAHVAGQHDGGADLLGQRLHPFEQLFALVGKRQFRAFVGHGLRDAPGDRLVVGQPHDQSAFACHQAHGRLRRLALSPLPSSCRPSPGGCKFAPRACRLKRVGYGAASEQGDPHGRQNRNFAGDDPFKLAQTWLSEAEASEINDPNAIALASVDADGLPNVRMVLLKEIEAPGAGEGAFVFYTNYDSAKGRELAASGKAAFVVHWKSLRRQIRVRGVVEREEGPQADAYYASRSIKSRLGAWASEQSRPLDSRATLMAEVARVTAQQGTNPTRPPFWGGFRIAPGRDRVLGRWRVSPA